jgi:phosphatidylglycerol:prolipoprotein diacylglycerol transferase
MAINFPPIDPIIFHIAGPLAVSWYSLAYVFGIIIGVFYIKRLNKSDAKPLMDTIFDDIISWIIIGIILGGRLGYVLFYNPLDYLSHPVEIFKTWQGGMSFHGGIIGVIISLYLFCKKHKCNYLQLMDLVSAATPIGIFFGRIANFINGELYGRVTDLPWGVIFPHNNEHPRHPSQLYESLLEGFLLFWILFICAKKQELRAKRGLISAIFLLSYGLFRMMIENLREPDQQLGLFLGHISMGQILCLPLIIFAIILMRYSFGRNIAK